MEANSSKAGADGDTPEKVRAFIAVEIPEGVKAELGRFEARLKMAGADVKWVRPESMHITLRFMGYLSKEQVRLAEEAVVISAEKFTPFQIEVQGLGTFPENKRPRVIWAGLSRGAKELSEVFQSLEQELILRDLGEADRPFAGHLTLGRVKTGKNLDNLLEYLNKEGSRNFGGFEVKNICLYQSRLHPTGAVYTVLKEGALTGGPGGV